MSFNFAVKSGKHRLQSKDQRCINQAEDKYQRILDKVFFLRKTLINIFGVNYRFNQQKILFVISRNNTKNTCIQIKIKKIFCNCMIWRHIFNGIQYRNFLSS